ncbi:MAG: exosortase/archaeosortase family protein [Chthoniobacterales bacterium]|nr:exosortase/archaeosortase family protein [Chthoniobacterales bacterium]
MGNAAISAPTAHAAPTPSRRLSLAAIAAGLALAALWLILFRHLSNEWSTNEQYSYGWFVPFFAAFLFWLRWEDRPPRADGAPISNRASSFFLLTSTFLLFFLLPLRLFEVGNPDWRPLGWAHAGIVVALTLLFIWTIGGRRWVWHFAFPVAFILVAVPWISPIEAPLVQGLMRVVALVATEALGVFGIPAQLEGSLIRVSTGLVGVNEACSGVRSLQTSLMIGLLFGELKRLSVPRRLALLGGALAIALGANFARAFTLVWISATQNPEAANSWHDSLGYSIVGLVFIGSMALAALLGKAEGRGQKAQGSGGHEEGTGAGSDGSGEARATLSKHPGGKAQLPAPTSPTSSFFLLPSPIFLLPIAWIIAIELGTEAWYRSSERDLIARESWTVRWPESAPGFRQIDIDEAVQRTLRYDAGRQVVWTGDSRVAEASLVPGGHNLAPRFVLFFFRWEPGTSTILRARAHRPDVCLPNVGWRQIADHGVRSYPVGGGLSLPFRHFSFIREMQGQRPMFAHSFFCIREDKVQPEAAEAQADLVEGEVGGWMRGDRMRVVREGLRNPGQQVMQFVVITPEDAGPATAEAEFRQQVPKLIATGVDGGKVTAAEL